MDPKNPYRSPMSDLSPPTSGVDTTNPLDPSGRFGRLSWMAWNMILAVLGILIVVALMATGMIAMPDPETAAAAGLGAGLSVGILVLDLVLVVFGVLLTIRRFHDMDASGWWSALLIVPLANLIVFLVLAIKRGSPGANRFGPPRPTAGWEKVLGILYIVLMVVGVLGGIVAAIAIPAYMEYQTSAAGMN
jgi:uncharacterized membrane protein YhaH (DUF805 family)